MRVLSALEARFVENALQHALRLESLKLLKALFSMDEGACMACSLTHRSRPTCFP